MPTLQTSADAALERLVVSRISAALPGRFEAMPAFSLLDYGCYVDGVQVSWDEVKTRKPSLPVMMSSYPEGLMLKGRKIDESLEIERQTGVPVNLWFAFRNGEGAISCLDPNHLTDLERSVPPPRHNYRGLPCDLEEVVYIPWRYVEREIVLAALPV